MSPPLWNLNASAKTPLPKASQLNSSNATNDRTIASLILCIIARHVAVEEFWNMYKERYP